MRPIGFAAITFMLLVLLTGCWNRMELDSLAFVQGIAIDLGKGETIELTIQFHKPKGGGESGGGGGGEQEKTIVNIRTRDESVFEAIRDITMQLGRKASWTHMRVIILGEQIARKFNIGELLDYFGRDYEPRATTIVMIGKDRGDKYLKSKPFIESSMSQQLRESESAAYNYSGKTLETDLMDIMLQLKGQVDASVMPYVYFDPKNKPATAPVAGLAMLKKGKMIGIIPSKKIEGYLMLAGKYKGGIIQVPCENPRNKESSKMDSVEVEAIHTKTKVKIANDSASVFMDVKIKGYIGEISCHSLKTPEEAEKFNEVVRKTVEKDLYSTLEFLQEQKMDALGIGNYIFRQNPALWKQWKADWDERFARTPFTIKVEANIHSTGYNLGVPLAK